MGILSGVVASTSSIYASLNQPATPAKGDALSNSQTAQALAANTAHAGNAAMVSLGATSITRPASYGSNKAVDSPFSKENNKSETGKSKASADGKNSHSRHVNVVA